jgi:hypothetical protein
MAIHRGLTNVRNMLPTEPHDIDTHLAGTVQRDTTLARSVVLVNISHPDLNRWHSAAQAARGSAGGGSGYGPGALVVVMNALDIVFARPRSPFHNEHYRPTSRLSDHGC